MTRGDTSYPGSTVRPERYLLLSVLVVLAVYTVAPFEFSFTASELKHRADDLLRLSVDDRGWKLAGHLAGFLVAGGLAGTIFPHRPNAQVMCGLLCFGAVYCLSLEILQLLQVSRHARLIDLIANFGAWGAGAVGVARMIRTRENIQRSLEWLRRHLLALFLPIALLAVTWWIAAGIFPLVSLRNLDWDRNFRLLLGIEEDGTEGWLGDIKYLRIYDTALSPGRVRELSVRHSAAAFQTEGAAAGLLVGYDFSSAASPYPGIFPPGTPPEGALVLEAPRNTLSQSSASGVRFTGTSGLTSRGPARHLADAIVPSGAFSIETLIHPLSDAQEGPARIVSYSSGIWYRNFMLGQEGADLVFRVRNGINGANGLLHAARALHAIDASPQHIVAVYDHGVSMLYRNGKLVGQVKDLRDPSHWLGLGSAQASWATAAVLLVLFVAIPVHFLTVHFAPHWNRHATAAALTLGVGFLPYALSPLVVGGPLRPGLALWIAAALGIVYPLALTFIWPRPVRAPRAL